MNSTIYQFNLTSDILPRSYSKNQIVLQSAISSLRDKLGNEKMNDDLDIFEGVGRNYLDLANANGEKETITKSSEDALVEIPDLSSANMLIAKINAEGHKRKIQNTESKSIRLEGLEIMDTFNEFVDVDIDTDQETDLFMKKVSKKSRK